MTPLRGERDARLIDATAFLRSAAVGVVAVMLAIHLAEVGFSATKIGLLIGVGLIGSSLATTIVSLYGDTWGRRRVLIGIALLSAIGYFALAFTKNVVGLVPLAFIGMMNGMGRDRGAASTGADTADRGCRLLRVVAGRRASRSAQQTFHIEACPPVRPGQHRRRVPPGWPGASGS
jgi:MFS family permease